MSVDTRPFAKNIQQVLTRMNRNISTAIILSLSTIRGLYRFHNESPPNFIYYLHPRAGVIKNTITHTKSPTTHHHNTSYRAAAGAQLQNSSLIYYTTSARRDDTRSTPFHPHAITSASHRQQHRQRTNLLYPRNKRARESESAASTNAAALP